MPSSPLRITIAPAVVTETSGVARAASLSVLVLQNTALALLLHASRTRADYSAATAVLVNELLKGLLSLVMAYRSTPATSASIKPPLSARQQKELEAFGPQPVYEPSSTPFSRLQQLRREIFSADCWKLGVPAVVYVIQNNLQFVAASNLDVATFQVTYQLKIMTTALFSVLLLKKSLSFSKWTSLFFLAIGVALVQYSQIQDVSYAAHTMNRLAGFSAVLAACLTSGLAGVYFEMVLKGSTASIWVRNAQLSLFSIVPALLPALRPLLNGGSVLDMFHGFGGWAWAVVWCQVIGGLATALVIKYSDNIVKGFATSLAIVLSCIASAVFFPEEFTFGWIFVFGTAVVLGATALYNRKESSSSSSSRTASPLLPSYSSLPSTPRLSTIAEEQQQDSALLVSPEYGPLCFVEGEKERSYFDFKSVR